MNNIFINSKSVFINGSIKCYKNITFEYDLPIYSSVEKDSQTILHDLKINGDLYITGNLHFVLPDPISSYMENLGDKDIDVLIRICSTFLDINMYEKFDNSIEILDAKNVYLIINNFRIGNDIIGFYNPPQNLIIK